MPRTEVQLRESFNLFDANRSGTIDATELFYALQGIGHESITEEDVAEMMRRIDKDCSGQIDFDEFKQLVTEQDGEADGPREILRAFRAFDVRGVGEISQEDLRVVADSLGYSRDQVSPDDIREIHAYCSDNDDGRFSFYAWQKVVSEMVDVSARKLTRSASARFQSLPSQEDRIWETLRAQDERERALREERERKRAEDLEYTRQRAVESRERLARFREEQALSDAQRERTNLAEWGDAERQKEESRERLAARRALRSKQKLEDEERARQAAAERASTEERIREKRERLARQAQ
eukprot:TRINITY_DN16781_c0_g1_i1.p1 TRINITY_DN16781_c0_g1~~TRINITY_DN16781_c0_g1_i1.p1  ORF type:complete len:317 (+),score=132.12 TRINITY_DN16781_c0_g1_i1:68-952(+)